MISLAVFWGQPSLQTHPYIEKPIYWGSSACVCLRLVQTPGLRGRLVNHALSILGTSLEAQPPTKAEPANGNTNVKKKKKTCFVRGPWPPRVGLR